MRSRPQHVSEVLAFIGANVRRVRAERDWTQNELAGFAGLDLSSVTRVERGVTNMTISILVALANALQVPPGTLFRPTKIPRRQRGRPRKHRRSKGT